MYKTDFFQTINEVSVILFSFCIKYVSHLDPK